LLSLFPLKAGALSPVANGMRDERMSCQRKKNAAGMTGGGWLSEKQYQDDQWNRNTDEPEQNRHELTSRVMKL
jgi:hypothetical protein